MLNFVKQLFRQKPKVGDVLFINSTPFTIDSVGAKTQAHTEHTKLTCLTRELVYLPQHRFWTLMGREGILPPLTK